MGGEVKKPPSAHEMQRCGAKTRSGHPCKNFPLKGRTRCKLHGGASTGARTAAGIERIRQAHLKSGLHTKEAIAQRKQNRQLIRTLNELMKTLK